MAYRFLLEEFKEKLNERVARGELEASSKENYLKTVSRILEAVLQEHSVDEIISMIKKNDPKITKGWLDEIKGNCRSLWELAKVRNRK